VGEVDSPRGTRITYIDITERKATEMALLRSVQQAETLMESALDCVILADSAGRITRFNRAAERVFGYRREEAAGQPLIDLLAPPHLREPFAREFGRLLASDEAATFGERHETPARRANGTSCPVELAITVSAGEDEPVFVAFIRDISQRVTAEEALRASEERFRGLVQGSHDIITVVHPDGRRRYVSPSIEAELGYPPAELLAAGSMFDLLHPADAPLLRAAIAEVVAGAGRTPPLELRLRHRDGGWRIFETIGTNHLETPHIAGIVFNSREITWRKATEAALRESEARFRAAFDDAPIGLMIFGPDGEITQVNRSLCTLLGWQERELSHMRVQQIAHPDDLADAEEQAKRLFAGEIATYDSELRLMRKDGSPVWTEMTVSAVSDDGLPHRAIAQIQDITGRRNLDLERATMLASERAYTRRLHELASLRADFSAMIAHELRTPIATLRMMTATLETGALPADAESEMLAAMQGQIEQLDRLVNDVAAAASAEHVDFSVQLHSVPLPLLITGVASAASGILPEHPLSVGPAPERQVWCDPERISQVLGNLLENVGKHTPPGTPVELRALPRADRVRIEVADRGPGISEEDQSVIFEKFGRGRLAVDRQSPGLGLGLYLSGQIVQAHGSDLTVETTPDGETIFGFDLRVAR
jgi:PAS domain S-box-containing protein